MFSEILPEVSESIPNKPKSSGRVILIMTIAVWYKNM